METDRSYRDGDFPPVRRFLERMVAVLPPGHVWDVRRWDGSHCHTQTVGLDRQRQAMTRIWEHDGRIVAVCLSEGDEMAFPVVDPEWVHLTPGVVDWVMTAARATGLSRLVVPVPDDDMVLGEVLAARWFSRSATTEVEFRTRLGEWPLPEVDVSDGYVIRTLVPDGPDDGLLAELLNAAFRRTSHHAAEHRWFAVNSPSYREETDLAMIGPDGDIAAYAAVCWDHANAHAIFEPVCTSPAHLRRGLARALMLEGFRRARQMGAVTVGVATGDATPAVALYRSLPFQTMHRSRHWEVEL